MQDRTAPTGIKELKQFLGFANCCNRFTRSFGRVALPISKLL